MKAQCAAKASNGTRSGQVAGNKWVLRTCITYEQLNHNKQMGKGNNCTIMKIFSNMQ